MGKGDVRTRRGKIFNGASTYDGRCGAANLSQRLASDAEFKGRILSYIRSIVRETVDISLGQQFQPETPGSSVFSMPDDMTLAEFQGVPGVRNRSSCAMTNIRRQSVPRPNPNASLVESRFSSVMNDGDAPSLDIRDHAEFRPL